jgi:hypothetical protein
MNQILPDKMHPAAVPFCHISPVQPIKILVVSIAEQDGIIPRSQIIKVLLFPSSRTIKKANPEISGNKKRIARIQKG